jgi:glutathione synthase/RimK-type ligase-like ATP-grasp enzyme
MIYLMPYKLGSESAKALAEKLNALRITGKKKIKRQALVLRWGNTDPIQTTRLGRVKELNSANAIALAKNKLATYKRFNMFGVDTVEYTTDKAVVLDWLRQDSVVYGRRTVTGYGGDGIVIITAEDDSIPSCPVYTKAILKAHEYRVHVFGGRVIDFTKKKRRSEGSPSPYIKNFDNGWVFCRDDVTLPERVAAQCIKAVQSLGLDFGACDVLYKERDDKVAVLEVNTAPGIEGTTLDRYVNVINSLHR